MLPIGNNNFIVLKSIRCDFIIYLYIIFHIYIYLYTFITKEININIFASKITRTDLKYLSEFIEFIHKQDNIHSTRTSL